VNVVFEHWSASWPVLIAYVILAAAHLAGLRRTLAVRASGSRRELVREAVMFQLGLAVIGMVLVFASGVFYPVYANSAHQLTTVLDDQQLSGAVLWMGILAPLIVAGVALLMEWFSNEESAELAAGMDRLLTPRPRGWPSRPMIR
jgi:hypothetical protein